MRRWLPLLVLALVATAAVAQEHRVGVQVETIAGTNVYLSAGTDSGFMAGDTLIVFRDDRPVGRLIVVSATTTRSVVTFADAVFPLTRGDRLTVVAAAPPMAEPEAAPTDSLVMPERERVSIFDQSAAPFPSASSPDPVRLTGRLQFGTNTLWSSTSPFGGGDARTRTFATPFVGMRGRLTGLPGGLGVNVNGRLSYRYRSEGSFEEPTDLRLYQASVERDIGLVRVEAGRFYNEYDRYSGYLDGVSLHVGSQTAGAGITAGVQPERADGLFSTTLPKYTVFGHYRIEPDPLRVEVRAVAGQVLPQIDGLVSRTFFGLTHRTSGKGFSVSTDLLVDEDPATGDLAFSRLGVNGSVNLARGLRLRGRYQQRRPYILFESLQVLRDQSERIGAGISYRLPQRTFGGTVVRADIASASSGDLPASLTVSGGGTVPRLPIAEIGLNVNASVWTRGRRESVYASASLTRSFGRINGSLGYRYQQTPLLDTSLITHGIEGALQVPLRSGVALTMQGSAAFGETVSNARLYTGLWWRL